MTEPRLPPSSAPHDAVHEAAVLANALPYLRRYAGDTIVVKYGGHAMGDAGLAKTFGRDIALLKQVGINLLWCMAGGRRSTRCSSGWTSPPTSLMGCA